MGWTDRQADQQTDLGIKAPSQSLKICAICWTSQKYVKQAGAELSQAQTSFQA